MKALLIKQDSTCEVVAPENGTDFTLQELYGHIECQTVERVPLKHEKELWLDEEGKLTGKELNILATNLLLGSYPETRDWIAGNALVCDKGMVK